MKYVVITPVRNEAEYLPLTVRSVATQTIRPTRWIIVDDGSTDETRSVAAQAAREYSWISVVSRSDRGFREAGGGVINTFYDGYRLLEGSSWDYLVKLDGDLSFDATYFERCLAKFDADPRLGIGGGTICSPGTHLPEAESKIDPKFHVRGATKIYRYECWKDIGGLIRAPGWDTLDEVKANMLGWVTLTFDTINILHHRPTGAAYGSWNDRVKSGFANYVSGYHPVFMFLKCMRRMTQQPYFVGGCALFFGFVKGYLKRLPQVDDKELIRYFRQQQINRLFGRKSLWG